MRFVLARGGTLFFCFYLSSFILPSSAAAQFGNSKQIRLVYLVPSDKKTVSGYRDAIVRAAQDLQCWYWKELGKNKTFNLSPEIVEVRQTKNPTNWYTDSSPDGKFDTTLWNNTNSTGFSEMKARFDDPDNRWIFFIDAQPKQGQVNGGTNGVAVIVQHDLIGLSGGSGNLGRWIGGLGHEIGHALGMDHPPGCNGNASGASCSSLMYLGYTTYPNTYLTPEHKAFLNSSSFFFSTNGSQLSGCSGDGGATNTSPTNNTTVNTTNTTNTTTPPTSQTTNSNTNTNTNATSTTTTVTLPNTFTSTNNTTSNSSTNTSTSSSNNSSTTTTSTSSNTALTQALKTLLEAILELIKKLTATLASSSTTPKSFSLAKLELTGKSTKSLRSQNLTLFAKAVLPVKDSVKTKQDKLSVLFYIKAGSVKKPQKPTKSTILNAILTGNFFYTVENKRLLRKLARLNAPKVHQICGHFETPKAELKVELVGLTK